MLGMRPVWLWDVMRENTKWSIEVRVRVFYPCYIPDNFTLVKLELSSNSSLSSKTSIKISMAAAFYFFGAIFNRRVLDLARFGFGN